MICRSMQANTKHLVLNFSPLQGDRGSEDRIREIEQQLEFMKGRLEKHLTKEKVIPDDRLSSLKKRMQTYEDQLADLRNGQEL